ncbi:hypothetical protein PPTG_23298 [Phytophthora nicotianae INRA-310]|uniref:Uncharacterized protein n=1 Tax=Phytophthora nicotianae (strain INRA-310) TaxID=761204 RepID=W2Q1N6_PHYN3|nr:hypothetical protein PPTG_23298 [Phytophthora nicotianae INRA-310]ETN06459.1 hypothetical protein PPTG_23298 [Phytophthora nicotianae INRA-310]
MSHKDPTKVIAVLCKITLLRMRCAIHTYFAGGFEYDHHCICVLSELLRNTIAIFNKDEMQQESGGPRHFRNVLLRFANSPTAMYIMTRINVHPIYIVTRMHVHLKAL